jgi:teichuronic acid biosynthesis glycosyltransferase TuaC
MSLQTRRFKLTISCSKSVAKNRMNPITTPRVLVFSALFPSKAAPTAGTFIKERMMRVAQRVPLVILSPQPWSPLDFVVRIFFRKTFRPIAVEFEMLGETPIYRPKYFSLPLIFKKYDGWLMARGARKCALQINHSFKPNIIDAHFLFPDGNAASILAKELSLPLVVTLRGSKDEWLIGTDREPKLKQTLEASSSLISVSAALRRDVAMKLGQPEHKCTVIGNGVDLSKFSAVDRTQAREKLGISEQSKVIISVGGLIERKGFHRIIPLIASLKEVFPDITYLIVGGGTSQDDMSDKLKELAQSCGVAENIKFCGPQLPENLKWFYGAADVFALATAHEGWANVFLEAMACGLPVITTDVGGNTEVVCNANLGITVDFFDSNKFKIALSDALKRNWDRDVISNYAKSNTWEKRVDAVIAVLETTLNSSKELNGLDLATQAS